MMQIYSYRPRMSASARASLYFKHHVGAVLKVTPAPTSSKEVAFIHQSFKRLGSLEYFSISKGKVSAYEPHIRLLYNPSQQPLQLNPFNDAETDVKESNADLVHAQESIVDELSRICALPRFSYIEGDEEFFLNKLQVDFKHALKRESLRFDNTYSISPSTVNRPFAYITVNKNSHTAPSEIISSLRHNFQKCHKIENMHIFTGLDALEQVCRSKIPDWETSQEVSLSRLMDLEDALEGVSTGPKAKPEDFKRVSAGFTGFRD